MDTHRDVDTRALGGTPVGALGLGTLAFTGGYGAVGEADAIATVHAALDHGVSVLDTADFYGGGAVEELLGRALAGRRAEAFVATRGGAVFSGPARPTSFDGSPGYLRKACDASLARLGTDHIDLYYLARVDPAVPVEESVGGLAELVAEGKIRHIGLSEAGPDQLRRAAAVHPVAALATEYSLWSRDVEDTVLPAARELGTTLVACSPLGRGFLTGATAGRALPEGDYRRNHPRFSDANLPTNQALLERAGRIGDALDVPLRQLALAWVLSRGTDVLPIPGTRTTAHLLDNVTAARRRLPGWAADELAELFSPEAVAGSRIPAPRPAVASAGTVKEAS
ncbi:aldo/keto reductase [Streptomyces sp. SID8379]|uniref:aldo/keto reductase n=1 Tax=unclassified Streptomyces TaxID=2593676 RepID=UPI00035E2AF3|nr:MULTISPECIES: aldo/keto reductase [unclassified Streptomyces]MYW65847.1 aldo/keto reductase [Streptomyces sp. SID8379]